ncbi:hypothetical protein HC231_06220 [Brenneria izadpanahii]|uniref:Uncharacterized protein n=1 Tax=Brenneria izadpanahii TaxID=2722756 RepID=A0ABX7USK7_9GAMM|nr:hypothetical protein HC231_06220 [Brenneria izadpanahii]
MTILRCQKKAPRKRLSRCTTIAQKDKTRTEIMHKNQVVISDGWLAIISGLCEDERHRQIPPGARYRNKDHSK